MFGTIGGMELILIVVIALIVFGPRKLPDIGKSVGKMLVEFRRASADFQRTIEDEVEAEKRTTALPPPVEPAPAPPAPEGTVSQAESAPASELTPEPAPEPPAKS